MFLTSKTCHHGVSLLELSRRKFAKCNDMNATEISHYPFRVPYGSTIGDRLWMWGHHAHSVSDSIYGIPGGEEVDMAEACRLMGIPGCAVVRWRNMPPASGIDSYMEQFKTMRRVAFPSRTKRRGPSRRRSISPLGWRSACPTSRHSSWTTSS